MEKPISEMTDKELVEYYHKCKHLSTEYDVRQQVQKIALNSLYGALGNAFFRYSTTKMAAAVTTTGQMVIKTSSKVINKYVNDLLKHKEDEQVDYTIAGDTDSVTGDSLIYVDDKLITIEQFFDTTPNNFVKYDKISENYIKQVHNRTTKSFSCSKTYSTSIVYVMKHKVKKHMFRLTVGKNEVTLTEDHSVIVCYNGTITQIKPKDMVRGRDSLIYLNEFDAPVHTEEWTIEDLGIQNVFVYDLETENHMFFANDILVHNSCYFDFYDVLKRLNVHTKPQNEKVDFLDVFCKRIEEKAITPAYSNIFTEFNCECNNNALHMDREVIAVGKGPEDNCAIWTGKKHYIILVNDNENFRYDVPKMKAMGMSFIQSSIPAITRGHLEKVSRMLIEEGIDEVRKYSKEVEKEFKARPPEEVAFPRSVSDVHKYTNPSTGKPYDKEETWYDSTAGKDRRGGVPIQSSSAINFNYLLKKYGLEKTYQRIADGDKLKFLYLKQNPLGIKSIGFKECLPKEFELEKYVDYDVHFEKCYRKPLEDMLTECDLSLEKRATLDDFF